MKNQSAGIGNGLPASRALKKVKKLVPDFAFIGHK
jgi:hypothetical protein